MLEDLDEEGTYIELVVQIVLEDFGGEGGI